VRVFEFLNDRLSEEFEHSVPKYAEFLASRGRVMREVGETIVSASELHLLGRLAPDLAEADAAYRGAAVHIRIATELLLGGWVLQLPKRKRRKLDLNDLIKMVRTSSNRRRIHSGKTRVLLRNAEVIRRLGNTAAHSLVRRRSQELPPTRSNVYRGIDSFRQILGCLTLPSEHFV
jgi:hypothetical protein